MRRIVTLAIVRHRNTLTYLLTYLQRQMEDIKETINEAGHLVSGIMGRALNVGENRRPQVSEYFMLYETD